MSAFHPKRTLELHLRCLGALQQLRAKGLVLFGTKVRQTSAAPIGEQARSLGKSHIARIAPHRGGGGRSDELELATAEGIVEPNTFRFRGTASKAPRIKLVGNGKGIVLIAEGG